ncbi:YbfB/YjiJ family MFS transporter [bacterium]|nr:MAG: YbfB/YjiJ family MFS transporter [bacterium]
MNSPSSDHSTAASKPPVSPIITALWLALAPAIAIGFGRFGYSLVLPAMRSDLGWTYAQAGALNTSNAVGYLLGALLTAPLSKRASSHSIMILGFAVSVAALLATGLAHSFLALLVCRALIGSSAAFTFISASSLAARLGRTPAENALAMGLSMSGPGLGVILTGLIVPFVVAGDNSHWPGAWLAMATLGVLALLGVWFNTRQLGIEEPVGQVAGIQERANYKALRIVLVSYFLYGLGYIAYMTFLVAYVRSLGASPIAVALAWTVLGGSMIGSTFVWRRSFELERGGRTLALMGVFGALSSVLPLLSNSIPVLLLSACVFGLAAMPIFTAVTMLIRLNLPPSAWTSGIAMATVIFATGQSLGPIGSGWFADRFGPSASLWWTFSIMLLSAVIASFQKPAPVESTR